jgi:hypothetical protein
MPVISGEYSAHIFFITQNHHGVGKPLGQIVNFSIGQQSTSPGFEQSFLKNLRLVPIYQYGINSHSAENLPTPIETNSGKPGSVNVMALKDKNCCEYRWIMAILSHKTCEAQSLCASM